MSRYKSLIKYELLTIIRGGYVLAFALILPCVLFVLVGVSVVSEVPEAFKERVFAELFFGFSTLIPLAGVLLGHGANYSREYENNVPQRLNLFGIPSRKLIISKLVSQLIFVLFAFFVYFVFAIFMGVKIDAPIVIFSMLILLLVQSLSLFFLAHGIVCIFKKFGPTYAVSMICYFLFMIVSGNMGIRMDMLPEFARFIGEKILPFIQYTEFNASLLNGGTLDWGSLFIANVVFALIAGTVFLLSRFKDKRSF